MLRESAHLPTAASPGNPARRTAIRDDVKAIVEAGPASPPAAPPGADLSLLAAAVRRYGKALRRCRREPTEKAVHKLRTANRRLRAQLDLLRALVARREYRRVRRRLRRQQRATARLRDTQVQAARVRELLPGHPDLGPVFGRLERNEDRERRRLLKKLKGAGRLGKSLRSIERGAARELSDPGAGERHRHAVAQALRRAALRLAEFRAGAPRDADGIHRFRLALKKFRYMAEALPEGLSVLTRRELGAVRDLQRLAGDIHDTVLLGSRVRRIAARRVRAGGQLAPVWRLLRRERAERMRVWRARNEELLGSLDAICEAGLRMDRLGDRPGARAPGANGSGRAPVGRPGARGHR